MRKDWDLVQIDLDKGFKQVDIIKKYKMKVETFRRAVKDSKIKWIMKSQKPKKEKKEINMKYHKNKYLNFD